MGEATSRDLGAMTTRSPQRVPRNLYLGRKCTLLLFGLQHLGLVLGRFVCDVGRVCYTKNRQASTCPSCPRGVAVLVLPGDVSACVTSVHRRCDLRPEHARSPDSNTTSI